MDLENLHKQLDKNDSWIHNADTKLSIILTFLGVLGGIVLSQGKVFTLFEDGIKPPEAAALFTFALAFILLGISIATTIKGLSATLDNPKRGLWFFGDVAKYEDWHFFKRAKKAELPQQKEDDLLNQIHTTAQIASAKFNWVNISIKLSVWSLGFFATYFILFNVSPFYK